MKKTHDRDFFNCMALAMASVLSLSGCLGLKDPPDDLDYSYENIMPNETRFLTEEMNARTHLEGEWFWYKSVGSAITRVSAQKGAETETETGAEIDWYSLDNKKTIRISSEGKVPVEKICFEGMLTIPDWEKSANPTAYAGIGFNLCAPIPEKKYDTHFPHTLGTCNEGDRSVLQNFLGISFEIEYDLDNLPDKPRLVVQFRERGFQVDNKQPECKVFDEMGADVSHDDPECYTKDTPDENLYYVEAWHGQSYSYQRDSDSNPDNGVRNLSALQAIQFQLSSRKTGKFKFCLSDMKAIYADNPRSDRENTPAEIPEVDTLIQDDVQGTKCLSEITTPQNEDTNSLWVGGVDSDSNAIPLVDDSDREYWIMKKEVTARQLYACISENLCTATREWEACSAYTYKSLRESGEFDDADLVTAAKRSANCASWYDAVNFCSWIGGHLPNVAQWEWAAGSGKAPGDNKYPWDWNPEFQNNAPNCDLAIFHDDKIGPGCGEDYFPVAGCTRPNGNTEGGACDMTGNLWEWVNDEYAFVMEEDQKPLPEWAENYQAIKGGGFYNWLTVREGWTNLSISDSTSLEHPVEPHNPANVGFRCIRYVDEDDPCE